MNQSAYIQYQTNYRTSKMKKAPAENKNFLQMENDYRRNVNLSIKLNRRILKTIGAWPKSGDSSSIGKYFTWFLNAVCYFLISFLFVPCFLFLILEVNETYGRIKLIGPLSFFLMSFLKYHLLILHKGDILKCMEQIQWDWKNIINLDDRKIMVMHANYARRLTIICIFFMYSSFVFYYIVLPVSMGKIPAEDENLTFISLPFPSSMHIADYRQSPVNETFYCMQTLAGVVMHIITVGACGLAATFAVHACGQMEILINWLEHLIDGRADLSKTLNGRIASIVEHHVRILKFLALTEKALRQISFVEFLGVTMNLCLLGYYSLMEWNPKDVFFSLTYMVLVISLTFNIFIFCYIGELVVEQCRRVGEVSYMIDWYRLTGNKKLCCILFIAMSNSSIKLTAGNMVELSISTFSDVVRTAAAFFNMLRALT